MSKESDKVIIKMVLAGDIESFAELVERYQRDVIKVVSAMLFCRQESEDLVQKTFLRAYEKLEQFDIERDFSLWIKEIARNTVRMHVRKGKSVEKHLDAYRQWVLDKSNGNNDELGFRSLALKDCQSQLTERNQQLLKLRYQERMSMAEIADYLGRSSDAITKAVSRIRSELRLCINRKLMDQ